MTTKFTGSHAPAFVIISIMSFFIGVAFKSYFAEQEKWIMQNKTEMALYAEINKAWSPGKYLICKYVGKAMPCARCELGGEDPLTDFEVCSYKLQSEIK